MENKKILGFTLDEIERLGLTTSFYKQFGKYYIKLNGKFVTNSSSYSESLAQTRITGLVVILNNMGKIYDNYLKEIRECALMHNIEAREDYLFRFYDDMESISLCPSMAKYNQLLVRYIPVKNQKDTRKYLQKYLYPLVYGIEAISDYKCYNNECIKNAINTLKSDIKIDVRTRK